jgi:hypothetical protein
MVLTLTGPWDFEEPLRLRIDLLQLTPSTLRRLPGDLGQCHPKVPVVLQ